MVMGVVYAVRPSERRLALMRPLSLAGIFAALCDLLVGLANALRSIAATNSLDTSSVRLGALALSDALIPMFIAFACLTVAWLCVALGLTRHS